MATRLTRLPEPADVQKKAGPRESALAAVAELDEFMVDLDDIGACRALGYSVTIPSASCWRTLGWTSRTNTPILCNRPQASDTGLCDECLDEMRS